jgi:hypothetical protein
MAMDNLGFWLMIIKVMIGNNAPSNNTTAQVMAIIFFVFLSIFFILFFPKNIYDAMKYALANIIP